MADLPAGRIPHAYPLAVRRSGVMTAVGLLVASLPYALMRFAVLLAFSVACVVWMVVTIGGVGVDRHAHRRRGSASPGSSRALPRPAGSGRRSFATRCTCFKAGHVAVLTELITRGEIGTANEPMFAYGKRVVTERFGQVNAMFALGLARARHRSRGSIARSTGSPTSCRFPASMSIASAGHGDPARRDALHGQGDLLLQPGATAKPQPMAERAGGRRLLRAERHADPEASRVDRGARLRARARCCGSSLLIPAAALVAVLPRFGARESAASSRWRLPILFALAARGAFLKPVFLIMIMARFHALIEHEAINAEWVARLDQLSSRFRELGEKAAAFAAPSGTPLATATQSLPRSRPA